MGAIGALTASQENLNLLRDAAQLQTQLRHYDALVETRLTIVRTRPHLRQHWVALAVAYHLNGDLEDAKKTLEHYERSLKVRTQCIHLFPMLTTTLGCP